MRTFATSLTLREPLAVVDVLPPLQQMTAEPRGMMNRIKLLCMSLELPSPVLRDLASSFGDLKQSRNGRWQLIPRKIIAPQFSNWLAGREPPPAWRIAQLVVICEYIGIIRELQAADASRADRARVREQLKGAAQHVLWFAARAELQPFLQLFRQALLRRLELDQEKSAFDRALYERYAAVVAGSEHREQ